MEEEKKSEGNKILTPYIAAKKHSERLITVKGHFSDFMIIATVI